MKKNILENKSRVFSIKIYNLAKYLTQKNEHIIANQILRSGTSIGANIAESSYAASKLDFINKLQIAQKEANETKYWLNLLKDLNLLDDYLYKDLNNLCFELIRLLSSSIITSKKSINNQ